MNMAVFASGTGTTLQTLIDNQTHTGYQIVLVVANRPCQAIERAEEAHIPTLQSKDWELIDEALMKHQTELIVLAGFLAIVPSWFCEKRHKKIINIHPSLLPKHGGKGMYGVHVQKAVLEAGDKKAGCTVHYVSAEIDGGSIIAQSSIDILPNDTPETLSARVQQAEKQLLPKTIKQLIE
jgi:phosphoribosylglycinamide formyltransferase-1